MLIEIDGYNQQVLLTGQSCTLKQLRQKYKQAKKQSTSSLDIPQTMCTEYAFTQLPYDEDVKIDFVIDSDTDRIILHLIKKFERKLRETFKIKLLNSLSNF